MKQAFTLLTVAMLVYSCKNDDDIVPEYPSTYAGNQVEYQPVRLFANQGEINDPDVIQEFLDEYDENAYFNFNAQKGTGPDHVSVVYHSSDEVTIQWPGKSEDRIVKKQDALTYWEAADTATILRGENNVLAYVTTYKPLYYEEYPAPASSGYSTIVKFLPCYFVYETAEGITIPRMSYAFVRNTGETHKYEAVGGYNNVFNENALDRLQAGDTLAVQEYQIVLSRQ